MLVGGEIVDEGPPSELARMTRKHMANPNPSEPEPQQAPEPESAPDQPDLEERVRNAFNMENRNERRA